MSNSPPPPDEWPPQHPPSQPLPPGQGYPPPQPPGWGAAPPGSGGYFQPPPAQPYTPGGGLGSMGPGGTTIAEPGRRLTARILDFVIFLALWVAVFVAVIAVSDTPTTRTTATLSLDLAGILLPLGLFVVYWLYESLMASWRGQTLGKMIMKMRIVDEFGSTPTTGAAMKRSLVWLTPVIPCCIGYVAFLVLEVWGLVNMFNRPDRRTLMDQFAATGVVNA